MLGKALTTAAAGNAAGEGLYVEDVFSTYLYTGNGSTQTITNGIDLDGEGGLVWGKCRSTSRIHALYDTERGVKNRLRTNDTNAEDANIEGVTSFNSNGFTLGTDAQTNFSGNTFASWTFRKAPKFFDVVTYTGNNTAGREIAHNLGSVPGCIIVKNLTLGTQYWAVYHRGLNVNGDNAPETDYLRLNADNAGADYTLWNDTAPTDTHFTVGYDGVVNVSGSEFVAYLFAHNDGDGEFGESGDQDIIKCGSYTGTGSAGNFIDLGFEPQWVFIKNASATGNWWMLDIMRGASSTNSAYMFADTTAAESSSGSIVEPQSTGFNINNTGSGTNTNGASYIYIAIRRGPMKTPESGTEVFDVHYKSGYTFPTTVDTGFVTDAVFHSGTTSAVKGLNARLTTLSLPTYATFSESSFGTVTFDYSSEQDGFTKSSSWGGSGNQLYYSFRRAPGFFDVVAYDGNSTSGRTVDHNLGVVPELMIVKRRTGASDWAVYSSATGATNFTRLNTTDSSGATSIWNSTAPTDSVFTLGTGNTVNNTGEDYIAYLFATVPGISKVGSYTGNGTSQTIDCGFSAGARFVLIKRTDSTSNWNVFDTERGIVAGNDPRLELNTIDAQDTGDDGVDPDSSGFAVNYIATNDDDVNVSGGTYIFLAIA